MYLLVSQYAMKKILITWADWMLATDLIPVLEWWYELLLTDVVDLDITDLLAIRSYLGAHSPDMVINCAAYTAVDAAQTTWAVLNYAVNTLWVSYLATACAEVNIGYITISTDYVFSGTNSDGYLPTDVCSPCNAYGMAKYVWEQLARQYHPWCVVVRTSRLYWWTTHKNFVKTMQYLWEHKEEIRVVNDQHGLPTYAVDLAKYLAYIVSHYDTYAWRVVHATNTGTPITWYDFASQIMKVWWYACIVDPCSSEEYPTDAVRPAWSVMLSDDKEYTMPNWKERLAEYIGENK